ncbi:MAG: hypothetical protein HZB53_05620 [Chloroflexi bacterium]|nr:hypothetical protein [Chloroflexota bacterium]
MHRFLSLCVMAVWLVACDVSPYGNAPDALPSIAHVGRVVEVTEISIHEQRGEFRTFTDWSALTIVGQYDLMPVTTGYTGTASFSVRGAYGDWNNVATATESLTLPKSIVSQFLSMLAASPVTAVIYRAVPTRTESLSYEISIDIAAFNNRTFDNTTVFRSTSHEAGRVPWLVSVSGGKQGMIDVDTPQKAYDVLRPYLKQDVQRKMIDAAKGSK